MLAVIRNFYTFLPQQPKLTWTLRLCCVLLLATGLVVALSHEALPIANFTMGDKVLHATAFFGFAFFFHLAWQRSFWWQVFLPLAAYGTAIELFQGMTTWRSMSVGDVVADLTGILLYWSMYKYLLNPANPNPAA